MSNYREIADAVEREIATGRLCPGDRLPPQRTFADARGLAPSTVARVYSELARRGLVVGEVGRGTFVRTGPPTAGVLMTPGAGGRVNLATNVPVLPTQGAALTASAAAMVRRTSVFAAAMDTVRAAGTPLARRAVATFAARGRWRADPDTALFAGNGRQALAATIAAVVPPGHRLGAEALTYQSLTGIASRLGVEVTGVAMDGQGMCPDAVARAHRKMRLRALYLQPTLHNPLGITMPIKRRQQLVRLAHELGIVIIEDHVYSFLVDDPHPLCALAPDHVVMIDSLSKRVAPGVSLGWLFAPPHLVPALSESLRASALVPSGLALELGVRWMADGTVAALVVGKRRDALRRQRLLRRACADLAVRADPRAYHAWIELPSSWRAETFTAAASERGIAVAPATAFAVDRGHAPNAIRVALASPAPTVLAASLATLNALAIAGPRTAALE